ncbi:MAG TPA: protein kinase [Thermoanaerobaculia bacterium]|nr:protein kinase [Thermoanaerobaculia bacterium]
MLSTPVSRGVREIGPYQVLEDLGPAPFGTAYLAADTRSDRTSILKVIPASRPGSWQEAASWEILLAETEALGRIYHRGLPALLEVAEHDGSLLVAFAETEGRSLHELLAQGERPDRATLIDWGSQLLEILAEGHAEGILHRHIAEDEVILAPEGHLVLTGFGLTQLVFDPLLTLPPEQLAGELYTVQSDLYAVGSLLRRLTFAGSLRSQGGLGVRDPLFRVLARATSQEPAARYASAAEMAEALREAARTDNSSGVRPRTIQPLPTEGRLEVLPGAPRPVAAAPARTRSNAGDAGERDHRQALLLLAVTLLLMVFVLATGWFLLSRNGSPAPAGAHAVPGQVTPTASSFR